MRVLHVVDMIDPSSGGGTAERSCQMAMALVRAGEQCTILCTDVGLSEARRQMLDGVRLVAVPSLLRRFLVPRISSAQIAQLIKQTDVVHVIGHWSVLGARVCLEALAQGKPYVYSPAGSLRVFGRSALLKHAYNWLVGKRILHKAARCIAITEMELEQFREFGLSNDRFVVVPNGVHAGGTLVPDPESFRRAYGLIGQRIVLFLGRLSPIKGPDLLLNAFGAVAQQYPNVKLVIAGTDEGMGSALKVLAEQLGVDSQVLFVGFIGGQSKQDALAAADLLAVPSRQEAMSLVALEAGLCGTPVLLTDQCGFDEVAAVGGGYVVDASAEALAAGLERMLGSAEALPGQGVQLRELVLARYTWDGLTRQICQLYGELLDDGSAARSTTTLNKSEP